MNFYRVADMFDKIALRELTNFGELFFVIEYPGDRFLVCSFRETIEWCLKW
uniref:Uncharacterized protein n=1 Tax=Candidatus Kentrum sp. FW TaxID=2126338 RepID=A0A450U4Q3_9GAMM|nr:MAG: hypothetical protein BECKFW1821C_GA0114237_12101 [Candidatus Kentron sp. FW]